MSLNCYVIPQSLAAHATRLVKHVRHAHRVGTGTAHHASAPVVHAAAPAAAPASSCSAPMQAWRALRAMGGMPAAALVAGGLALGGAGAGLANAGAASGYGGGSGSGSGDPGGGVSAAPIGTGTRGVASTPGSFAGAYSTDGTTATTALFNPSGVQYATYVPYSPVAPMVGQDPAPSPTVRTLSIIRPAVVAVSQRGDSGMVQQQAPVEVPEPFAIGLAGFAAVTVFGMLARRRPDRRNTCTMTPS